MKSVFLLNLGFAAVLLVGCEATNTAEEYRKEAVVNATLFANHSVDTLWLQWTGEVNKVYDPKAYAITGAQVIINGIDVAFSDTLIYDAANPGRYYSGDSTKKILPTKSYSLYIKTPAPDQWILTSHTTVPDTFSILTSSVKTGDTIRYNILSPVNKVSWSSSNNYATFLPTIFYLDDKPALIPKGFYRDTTSKDFERPPKAGFAYGLPKEQTETDVPWIALDYFGNIQLEVYAIDQNYSDYINQVLPAKGSELKGIRYNVQGGLGIFAAKTKAFGSIRFYLRP